jgi:preprotein translocase subunit SecG
MTLFLTIIHIMVSLFLIAVVLLQSGKGAEMGAAFGGSSQTIFGSRGAASFLSKMTTVAAVVFMFTSLTLAVVTTRGGSVIKKAPVTQEQKSLPLLPGPGQSQGVQPVQPSQQAIPQTQQQKPLKTQQQVPQTQQQAPSQTPQ